MQVRLTLTTRQIEISTVLEEKFEAPRDRTLELMDRILISDPSPLFYAVPQKLVFQTGGIFTQHVYFDYCF